MSAPKVDRELVQQLAAMARLQVRAEDEAQVAARLGRVLEAFSALQQVDTRGVLPEPYPLPLPLRLRPDRSEPPLPREQVLANAARTAVGAFLVPRVVEA